MKGVWLCIAFNTFAIANLAMVNPLWLRVTAVAVLSCLTILHVLAAYNYGWAEGSRSCRALLGHSCEEKEEARQ
jgi:hypothetical protein